MNIMSKNYGDLWVVAKIILCLSHGQAQVERGFSINKEISCTNLKHKTLVAKRLVSDHITCAGGLKNVKITSLLRDNDTRARKR